MNHIPVEIIQKLYIQYFGTYMKCDFCGKRESLDEEFARCSRCQSITYCSRRCQKNDWKIHKERCVEINNHQLVKRANKIARRLDRFSNIFGPMVAMALGMRHAFYELENNKAIPETHVMMVHVSDLPEDAKKPRLRIDKIEPIAKVRLPERHLNNLEKGVDAHPPNRRAHSYFLVYETPAGPFYQPILTSFQGEPYSNKKLKDNRKMILVGLMAWIQTINDMAKGGCPDLWEVIKGE